MFQWSTNRRRTTDTGSDTAAPVTTYPAYRAGVETAPSIQGSIRPPSSYTKTQHLDSYLKDPALKRSTRKIPPGDTTYDTVFQTIHGDTLILRVHFTGDDTVPPQFSLAGVQATHSWLNERMQVTGYDPVRSLTTWRQSGLLLGKAVHALVQEFQMRPPVIQQFVDPNLRNIQTKTPPPPPDYSVLSSQQQQSSTKPAIDMPPIPNQFPELEELDRDDLDDLLKDELEFQTFCHSLPYFRETLSTMSVSVLDDNAETASQHLTDHEPILKELAARATELHGTLQQKVDEFQKLERQQDKLLPKPPDARRLRKDLLKAKKEAFSQSEQVADDWLSSSNKNAEAFIDEFMELRKLHHVRAAKLELLEQQPKR